MDTAKEVIEDQISLVPFKQDMFCWGNTANGELGLGGIEDHHILAPRELTFEEVDKVKYGKFFCYCT